MFQKRGSHDFNHEYDEVTPPRDSPPNDANKFGVINPVCHEMNIPRTINGHFEHGQQYFVPPVVTISNGSSPQGRQNGSSSICVISNINGKSSTYLDGGSPSLNGSSLPISSSTSSINSASDPIRLCWENLSYEVELKKWCFNNFNVQRKVVRKEILKLQHGEISSGQLIGIIGPSGAGKSTLLNCLTGRYRGEGVGGKIYVSSPGISSLGGKKKKIFRMKNSKSYSKNEIINVAFIPQRDNLFGTFTVKETLIFASKMKNANESSSFHEDEAAKVMKYLSLESCSKTYISKCSGGQVKRVCIGVELVSRPDILVLDEPTTGLDSSTAFQCVSILRKLVDVKDNPPAIIATIHQPSCKILKQFHSIYLLSKTGRCLYFGPPDQIKSHFSAAGLEFPLEYNPADFAIETAYGDYGEDIFDRLEETTIKSSSQLISSNCNLGGNNNEAAIAAKKQNGLNGHHLSHAASRGSLDSDITRDKIKITTIVKRMQEKPFSFLDHTYLLLIRNWMKIARDPGQLWLRLFQNIAIGLMVSYLWNPGIGAEDGCWTDFLDNKASNQTDAKNLYLNKISRINANSALLFSFLIYVVMVSVMSTVLSFPTETLVIIKEMKNSWYTCSTYYWAKFIAELPILFATILVLAAIIYPLTGQIPVLWRFLILYLVTCMMGEVCQSIGMMFGTIFSDDLISACFSSVASGFPPILFGGFVVQVSQIRWYLKPFVYMSYLRYAFESCIVAIYGFNRCEKKIANNVVDRISKANNPVALIGTLVSSFNLTSKDANSFSILLNVEKECIEGVINGTIDYFGIGKDPGDMSGGSDDYEDDYSDINGTMTTMKPYSLPPAPAVDEYEEASYVLSYYSLKEDVLLPNILTLIGFMILFKFITYFLLLRKARS